MPKAAASYTPDPSGKTSVFYDSLTSLDFPVAPNHPDYRLIDCLRTFDSTCRQWEACCRDIEDDHERAACLKLICRKQDILLVKLSRMRAVTVLGFAARARSFLQWNFNIFENSRKSPRRARALDFCERFEATLWRDVPIPAETVQALTA